MLLPVTVVIFVTVTKSHYRAMTARPDLLPWRELVASVSTLTRCKPFTVGAGGTVTPCQHGRGLVPGVPLSWRAVVLA